jgi:hypothetical protein
MYDARQAVWDDLSYYFVTREKQPGGSVKLSLDSHPTFRDDCKTLPFDSETDAALYFLDEFYKGASVSEQDVEIAKAIMRGDKPMFVHEEKQPGGTLLLSIHGDLPPLGSSIVAFGCRSPKWLARFLLRRLHESNRVTATAETIRQAQMLLG